MSKLGQQINLYTSRQLILSKESCHSLARKKQSKNSCWILKSVMSFPESWVWTHSCSCTYICDGGGGWGTGYMSMNTQTLFLYLHLWWWWWMRNWLHEYEHTDSVVLTSVMVVMDEGLVTWVWTHTLLFLYLHLWWWWWMRDWLHEYEHTDTVLVLTSVMVVMDEGLVTWVWTHRLCSCTYICDGGDGWGTGYMSMNTQTLLYLHLWWWWWMRDWLHEYEHTDSVVLTSVMVVMDEGLVTWVWTHRLCSCTYICDGGDGWGTGYMSMNTQTLLYLHLWWWWWMRDWLHEYEHTDTVLVLTSVMVVMDEELVTWVWTHRLCCTYICDGGDGWGTGYMSMNTQTLLYLHLWW